MTGKKVRVRSAPRESDEKILLALQLRQQGKTWQAIAKELGVTNWQNIQQACLAVLRESEPEPAKPTRRYKRRHDNLTTRRNT